MFFSGRGGVLMPLPKKKAGGRVAGAVPVMSLSD